MPQLICFINFWPLLICTSTSQNLGLWSGPSEAVTSPGMWVLFFPWCLAQQQIVNIWFCSEAHGLFPFLTLKYKLSWQHPKFSCRDREGREPVSLAQVTALFLAGNCGRRGWGLAWLPLLPQPLLSCSCVGILCTMLTACLCLFPTSPQW